MINARYDYANGKTMRGTAEDLSGVREAMFALQQHTETTDIYAVDEDTGEKIARLQFEWIEDDR